MAKEEQEQEDEDDDGPIKSQGGRDTQSDQLAMLISCKSRQTRDLEFKLEIGLSVVGTHSVCHTAKEKQLGKWRKVFLQQEIETETVTCQCIGI